MKNNLISKEEWIKQINKLETEKTQKDYEKCKKAIENLLVSLIKEKTNNLKFGILFSGGIDSSLIALICKKLNINFTCYCVGLENSKDLEYARKIADSINIELKTKTIKLNEIEKILKKVTKITKKKDVVNAGVGCVVYAALDFAKKDNNIFLTGMGADELFAGYSRFEKVKDIKKECISSIKNIYGDMERDFLIADNLNTKLITPFMDENIIKLAMQTPSEYKIKNNIRKYILRKIAIDLGLSEEFALRKKTAAQYGSRIDRAISKLAKINGFKYKKDYLESLS